MNNEFEQTKTRKNSTFKIILFLFVIRAFTKQPLFGIEFMIVGASEKLHDEIKNKILKMGGKVVAKIHTRLAAVISDEYTVNVGNPMIKEAHIHRIQVIPYDFLNEIMEADPVEVIVKRDLSKWGKGVRVYFLLVVFCWLFYSEFLVFFLIFWMNDQ